MHLNKFFQNFTLQYLIDLQLLLKIYLQIHNKNFRDYVLQDSHIPCKFVTEQINSIIQLG